MHHNSGPTLLLEFVCKVGYIAGLFVNVAGLVTASALVRQIARPFCGGTLGLLVLCWHRRLGWVNTPYACLVLAGLVTTVLGDLILAQPVTDFLDYTGFLFHEIALLLFIAALCIPTNPDVRREEISKSRNQKGLLTRIKEAAYGRLDDTAKSWRRSPPIPWRFQRLLLPASITIACLIAWRVFGGATEEHDPRYIATACMVTLHCVLMWRALARVGYAAPIVTVDGLRARHQENEELAELPGTEGPTLRADFGSGAPDEFSPRFEEQLPRAAKELKIQRAARNTRRFMEEISALESRWWQWCAVLGCMFMCVALLCLGYDRLWIEDDQSADGYASFTATWLTYVYTVASWAGQTLLVSAVPCELPKAATMEHPAVSPGPTEGQSLRVLFVLPGLMEFDIAEVAIPWYYLTKRGHTVLFATRAGYPGSKVAGPQQPYGPSVHGYGCAANCCRPSSGCCARRPARAIAATHLHADVDFPASPSRRGPALLQRNKSSVRKSSMWARLSEFLFGDMLSFSAVGVGISAPTPLVVALYRELLENSGFRRPLAYDVEALKAAIRSAPRKVKRKSRRENAFYEGASDETSSMVAEFLCTPEMFDGIIVAGTHPPTLGASHFDDPAIQDLIQRFWASGKPLGCLGNASLLLARTPSRRGVPLCHDAMLTSIPKHMELSNAFLHGLHSGHFRYFFNIVCRCCSSRPTTVQDEVERALRMPVNFVPGPNPWSLSALVEAFVWSDISFVRHANPLDDVSPVVVEDKQLITAQCGGDAFVFVRQFTSKLELVQRSF